MATRILFQGDSITDAMRSRESELHSGSGYPTLVSARLGFKNPGKYDFLNRGVSGNRSVDILARVREDIINLKPDIMSILVGVNDVWHELAIGNGVPAVSYETYYNLLVEQIRMALSDIRIMIMEPFVLRGTATEGKWDTFRSEVEQRAIISSRVAETFNLDFIPLQKKFDEVAELATPDFWLIDGVHPTAAGHELIACEWIKTFENKR